MTARILPNIGAPVKTKQKFRLESQGMQFQPPKASSWGTCLRVMKRSRVYTESHFGSRPLQVVFDDLTNHYPLWLGI